MKFELPKSIIPRDYQDSFPDMVRNLVASQPDVWHLFSAPTGTGKSIAQLLALQRIPYSILITPRLEIIAGMMEKLGHCIHDMTDEQLVTLSWKYNIITPIRLRNILSKGLLSFMPSLLIIDEAHHDSASTYQDITMYLNGCPKVGLTATPYRGTPKGTLDFLNQWNNTVHPLIDLATAINLGYCALPEVTIWPLLDDDTIDVQNGEFKWKSFTAANCIDATIQHVVDRVKQFYCKKSKTYDMPTMFAVPTTVSAKLLHSSLIKSNLPASIVIQDTKRSERTKAFENCVRGSTALVQISVVSEGVDLPIRRLIDLSPTMSPVKWIQQVGRIMRPSDTPPQYVCCCRNLERHCYLMDGLLPNSTVKEAQEAFEEDGKPKFSKRSGMRVVGLEGLGRFTSTPIFLMDGTIGFMYNLVHTSGFKRSEYLAFVHPNHPEPIRGMKVSTSDGTSMKWGRWELVDTLPDLKGCISAKIAPLTTKQQDRWNTDAADKGLNPHKTITSREFQILPFLMNTGLRFRT